AAMDGLRAAAQKRMNEYEFSPHQRALGQLLVEHSIGAMHRQFNMRDAPATQPEPQPGERARSSPKSPLTRAPEPRYFYYGVWPHGGCDLLIQIGMIATKEQRSARIAKLAREHRTKALLREWYKALDRPPGVGLPDPAKVTYPEFLAEFLVIEMEQVYDP